MKHSMKENDFHHTELLIIRLVSIAVFSMIWVLSPYVGDFSNLFGLVPLMLLWILSARALHEQSLYQHNAEHKAIPAKIKKWGWGYFLFTNFNFWFYFSMFCVVCATSLLNYDSLIMGQLVSL